MVEMLVRGGWSQSGSPDPNGFMRDAFRNDG
jgi:hypothetical protein